MGKLSVAQGEYIYRTEASDLGGVNNGARLDRGHLGRRKTFLPLGRFLIGRHNLCKAA